MQKKLESELVSIAHRILKLKNSDDVNKLKNEAYEVYEKLAVLAYIQKYVTETPTNTKTVEELVQETFEPKKEVVATTVVAEEPIEEPVHVETRKVIPEKVQVEEIDVQVEEKKMVVESSKIEEDSFDLFSKPIQEDTGALKESLEKEFGSTVALDVATDLFENAERVNPKKSINDAIMQQKNLQIDLNDRIAFVKHLFDGSQEDFNRVVSQFNTIGTEKEALSLLKLIKKEYNWTGKEVYEDRLISLIERKFN